MNGIPLATGWLFDPGAIAAVQRSNPQAYLADHDAAIRGSGKGQVILPYRAVLTVLGKHLYYVYQRRGTCVGYGLMIGLDGEICREIVAGERESWFGGVDHSTIYGGARVEIGGGKIRGDGAVVAEAVEYVKRYGCLARQRYEVGGKTYDLSTIDDDRAVEYGRSGVPDDLEPIAREHPLLGYSEIEAATNGPSPFEQLRDAMFNGGVCVIGCNTLFAGARDADGFVKREGSGGHCTPISGVRDDHRPGVLWDMRSWPLSRSSGPQPFGEPDGTGWVDADTFDTIVRSRYCECFVLNSLQGWPAKPVKHVLL